MTAQDTGSITDFLLADHRRLHELLARAMRSGAVERHAYDELRQGLLRHIAIEEKILFPAVKKAIGATSAVWHKLRVDHAALTSLLVPTPDMALLREISALLDEHDAKEEGTFGIYATCERALTAELLKELSLRAEALPPVRAAPNFDGHGVHRTRASALEAAARIRRSAARESVQ